MANQVVNTSAVTECIENGVASIFRAISDNPKHALIGLGIITTSWVVYQGIKNGYDITANLSYGDASGSLCLNRGDKLN